MSTADAWVTALVEQLSDRFEPWMSCDDCFDGSDTVLEELLDHGRALPDTYRAHVAGCPACLEELEVLAELAAKERGLDPALVRSRIEAELA